MGTLVQFIWLQAYSATFIKYPPPIHYKPMISFGNHCNFLETPKLLLYSHFIFKYPNQLFLHFADHHYIVFWTPSHIQQIYIGLSDNRAFSGSHNRSIFPPSNQRLMSNHFNPPDWFVQPSYSAQQIGTRSMHTQIPNCQLCHPICPNGTKQVFSVTAKGSCYCFHAIISCFVSPCMFILIMPSKYSQSVKSRRQLFLLLLHNLMFLCHPILSWRGHPSILSQPQ